jgi:hypothetical protein
MDTVLLKIDRVTKLLERKKQFDQKGFLAKIFSSERFEMKDLGKIVLHEFDKDFFYGIRDEKDADKIQLYFLKSLELFQLINVSFIHVFILCFKENTSFPEHLKPQLEEVSNICNAEQINIQAILDVINVVALKKRGL